MLPRAPFYPEAAVLALIAVPAFLALVWPFAGAVLTLAVLAPPVFAYGAGWGVIYVDPRRRRGDSAALEAARVGGAAAGGRPAGVDGLGGAGSAASRPGLLLRRWGALVGFFSGWC